MTKNVTNISLLVVLYGALQALSICHPLLKVRALSEGSKKAKGKAIRRAGRTLFKHKII